MEIIIIFVFFMAMMWFFSRQQKKMVAAASARREEALVLGNTVQTTTGMIGKIVDIDGDVVTLESASGDETQWLTTAIASVIEPPYGSTYDDTDEDETFGDDTDGLTPRETDVK